MGYDQGIGQMVVKLIGQFVVIVTNYVLSKLFIFRKPKKQEPNEDIDKTEGENEVG